MKRLIYFLKVWTCIMAFLVFCYLGVEVLNVFMDWVFTFTEEQIVIGIFVFAATVAAAIMTCLD